MAPLTPPLDDPRVADDDDDDDDDADIPPTTSPTTTPPGATLKTVPLPGRTGARHPARRVRVAIEGGIGVGKSTLLEALRVHFEADDTVCFHTEPVTKWIDSGLLGRMYSGAISKLAFQVIALTTRYGPLARSYHSPTYRVFITERSLFSDQEVFAKVNLHPTDEWPDYVLAAAEIQGAMPEDVQEVTVFLEASDAEVMKRIHERHRDEEKAIPMAYLARLREAHEAFYNSIRHEKIRVDASRDAASVAADVATIIDRIHANLTSPVSVVEPHRFPATM